MLAFRRLSVASRQWTLPARSLLSTGDAFHKGMAKGRSDREAGNPIQSPAAGDDPSPSSLRSSLRDSLRRADEARKAAALQSQTPAPRSASAVRNDILDAAAKSSSVSAFAVPEVKADEVTPGEVRHKRNQQKLAHNRANLERKYGDALNPKDKVVRVPVINMPFSRPEAGSANSSRPPDAQSNNRHSSQTQPRRQHQQPGQSREFKQHSPSKANHQQKGDKRGPPPSRGSGHSKPDKADHKAASSQSQRQPHSSPSSSSSSSSAGPKRSPRQESASTSSVGQSEPATPPAPRVHYRNVGVDLQTLQAEEQVVDVAAQRRILQQRIDQRNKTSASAAASVRLPATAVEEKKSKAPITVVKEVPIPSDGIAVRELASRLSMRANDVVNKLVELGELDESYQLTKSTDKQSQLSANRKASKASAQALDEVILEADVAELVVLELGFASKRIQSKLSQLMEEMESTQHSTSTQASEQLIQRPPMITIMGHVDHGKTTLLDTLRRMGSASAAGEAGKGAGAGGGGKGGGKNAGKGNNAKGKASNEPQNIADQEAGGITQRLSAFSVSTGKHPIIVVDTPGHAAFTSMRSMGVSLADLVVLLISMDDGIQPQTVESLRLAQSQGLPVLIALNKCDKYSPQERTAIVNRLNADLAAQHSVMTSDYGGETPVVCISAKTGFNVDTLLNHVHNMCHKPSSPSSSSSSTPELEDSLREESDQDSLLSNHQAGLLAQKLQVSPHGPAEGIVMDTVMEKGRGLLTNLVVTWGQLKVGDNVIIGQTYGRVRNLVSEQNTMLTQAGPGMVVKLVGLKDLPPTGTELLVVPTETQAKSIADRRRRVEELKQAQQQAGASPASSSSLLPTTLAATGQSIEQLSEEERAALPNVKTVRVVLKADSIGSLQALGFIVENVRAAAAKENVDVRVIHAQVGDILSKDIELSAGMTDCMILAFNVGLIDQQARTLSKQLDVKVHSNDIIYRLEEELVRKVEEYLPPMETISREGVAKVQKLFRVKNNPVAGLAVTSGTLYTNSKLNTSAEKSSFFYKIVRGETVLTPDKGAIELKRFKDSVKFVEAGQECGLHIGNFDDFQEGDIVECYKATYQPSTLNMQPAH